MGNIKISVGYGIYEHDKISAIIKYQDECCNIIYYRKDYHNLKDYFNLKLVDLNKYERLIKLEHTHTVYFNVEVTYHLVYQYLTLYKYIITKGDILKFYYSKKPIHLIKLMDLLNLSHDTEIDAIFYANDDTSLKFQILTIQSNNDINRQFLCNFNKLTSWLYSQRKLNTKFIEFKQTLYNTNKIIEVQYKQYYFDYNYFKQIR